LAGGTPLSSAFSLTFLNSAAFLSWIFLMFITDLKATSFGIMDSKTV